MKKVGISLVLLLAAQLCSAQFVAEPVLLQVSDQLSPFDGSYFNRGRHPNDVFCLERNCIGIGKNMGGKFTWYTHPAGVFTYDHGPFPDGSIPTGIPPPTPAPITPIVFNPRLGPASPSIPSPSSPSSPSTPPPTPSHVPGFPAIPAANLPGTAAPVSPYPFQSSPGWPSWPTTVPYGYNGYGTNPNYGKYPYAATSTAYPPYSYPSIYPGNR
eukprot:GILI01000829.1.p1 GENE.GILI01000829.1~~GILI01000829.1.p1  ORF type:complete len:213 (+),score=47.68 GILI01000829.1:55-693(+)